MREHHLVYPPHLPFSFLFCVCAAVEADYHQPLFVFFLTKNKKKRKEKKNSFDHRKRGALESLSLAAANEITRKCKRNKSRHGDGKKDKKKRPTHSKNIYLKASLVNTPPPPFCSFLSFAKAGSSLYHTLSETCVSKSGLIFQPISSPPPYFNASFSIIRFIVKIYFIFFVSFDLDSRKRKMNARVKSVERK